MLHLQIKAESHGIKKNRLEREILCKSSHARPAKFWMEQVYKPSQLECF